MAQKGEKISGMININPDDSGCRPTLQYQSFSSPLPLQCQQVSQKPELLSNVPPLPPHQLHLPSSESWQLLSARAQRTEVMTRVIVERVFMTDVV